MTNGELFLLAVYTFYLIAWALLHVPERWAFAKVRPFFAWHDFWVGWYWSSDKRCLYVILVPCVGLRLTFAS